MSVKQDRFIFSMSQSLTELTGATENVVVQSYLRS